MRGRLFISPDPILMNGTSKQEINILINLSLSKPFYLLFFNEIRHVLNVCKL